MNQDKLYMVRESIINSNPKELRKEVIFDWDDNQHFAIAFAKGDSRFAVASKLYDAARELLDFAERIDRKGKTQ